MPMLDIPKLALSIQQPWAWLIVNGHKDIENRSWATKFRGPVAIHAGKKLDRSAHDDVRKGIHPALGSLITYAEYNVEEPGLGGIIGVATITGCVTHSPSPWFFGTFGFTLEEARPVPFIPVKGALGFFDWRKNLPEAS
jgi:hypothetical protein